MDEEEYKNHVEGNYFIELYQTLPAQVEGGEPQKVPYGPSFQVLTKEALDELNETPDYKNGVLGYNILLEPGKTKAKKVVDPEADFEKEVEKRAEAKFKELKKQEEEKLKAEAEKKAKQEVKEEKQAAGSEVPNA